MGDVGTEGVASVETTADGFLLSEFQVAQPQSARPMHRDVTRARMAISFDRQLTCLLRESQLLCFKRLRFQNRCHFSPWLDAAKRWNGAAKGADLVMRR